MIVATFTACWVLDAMVVTPVTRLLLLPQTAAVLQWPVLVYSISVLVAGTLAHAALAVWYLVHATPWVELGGAGVLHVPPLSPLVRAYHAYHFGQPPPDYS